MKRNGTGANGRNGTDGKRQECFPLVGDVYVHDGDGDMMGVAGTEGDCWRTEEGVQRRERVVVCDKAVFFFSLTVSWVTRTMLLFLLHIVF